MFFGLTANLYVPNLVLGDRGVYMSDFSRPPVAARELRLQNAMEHPAESYLLALDRPRAILSHLGRRLRAIVPVCSFHEASNHN